MTYELVVQNERQQVDSNIPQSSRMDNKILENRDVDNT